MYKSYIKFMERFLCVESNDKYITAINFVSKQETKYTPSKLTEKGVRELEEYLYEKRHIFSVPIFYKGTSFQEQVWDALLNIPYGEVLSYKELAEKINRPKAYRAVGTAVSKNNLSIIVPCHRIIKSNGEIGNYGGGQETKIKLLKLEKYI
ncbi:MAG: methylated-DNA--[protein]-cysteine S-methyltransferase [Bacilli bacterium]